MAQRVKFQFAFQFHIFVYPAPDLEGQWMAHSLELDIVAQGDSKERARDALVDAVDAVVRYNLDHGLVPIQVSPAPHEVWKAAGIPMPSTFEVDVKFRTTSEPAERPLLEDEVPFAFQTIVGDRAPVCA